MKAYRANGFPVTIVRPSLTYGLQMIPYPMNSWNAPWTLIDRLKKGEKIIVPGDGTSLFQITYNDDFAKGFIGLIGNDQAIKEAYHITTDEVMTWDQIVEAYESAMGPSKDIN